MNEIIIIDCSVSGIEGTAKNIIQFLNRKNIHPHLVQVFKGGHWMTDKELLSLCAKIRPDTILWDGAMAWKYSEVFKRNECRKVNLFFDDPVMRIEGLGFEEQVKECAKREDFEFHIWDQYWMQQAENLFGIKSSLIHLSCDEDEYYTTDTKLSDECVFIGCLHSRTEIQKRTKWCNPIFQKVIKSGMEYISNANDVPSWDYVENEVLKDLSSGDLRIYNEMKFIDHLHHLQVRWCLWAHAKNEVRVRSLKQVLKVMPLLMFTETKQKGHANEDELKHMLEDHGNKLKIVDTSGVKGDKLGNLYHYGSLHFGATDPQSVNTGIPYRVFQTMASGRTLLTDEKPGWKDFLGDSYVSYSNYEEIPEKISEALKLGSEFGKSARDNFDIFHKWDHRLSSVLLKRNAILDPMMSLMQQNMRMVEAKTLTNAIISKL